MFNMHEGWSLQEIKELREWSTEGDEKKVVFGLNRSTQEIP